MTEGQKPASYAGQQAVKRQRIRIFCQMCREFHTFRRSEGAEYQPSKDLDTER